MGCANTKHDVVKKKPVGFSVSSTNSDLTDINVSVPDPFRSYYKVTDIIFEKGHRKLCRGISRTRNDVVIECTNLKAYQSEGFTEIDYYNRLDILRQIDHECTPKVLDFFDGSQTNKIVFEYVPGRDLKYILKTKGPLPSKIVKLIALAIISVLKYLHKNGIIHRNISTTNIILASFATLSDQSKIKVVGFTRPASVPRTRDGIVEPRLLPVQLKDTDTSSAPELCMADHGPAVDLFSLGAVIYESVTGSPPDTDDLIFGLEWSSEQLVAWRLQELVVGLLSKDPLKRPSLKAAEKYFC